MNILGISAFFHDSAACLVSDGDIVAAAQEERFTRLKHDPGFPAQAVASCLAQHGIDESGIDWLAFYEKPFLKFDRLLETYLAFAPAGLSSFAQAIPAWLKDKLHLRRRLRTALGPSFRGRLVFTRHHEAHAASAFFPSPFAEAAIVTVDGVGEWSTTTIGHGQGNRIELLKEIRFPHSLGLLYSAFTAFAGFKVNSGEYKLMGLAPYGEPVYADLIRERLCRIFDDGSLWLDMDYFNYCQGLTMTSEKFHRLFGGEPRHPESRITKREMDLAASIQEVCEEVMVKLAAHARQLTGCRNLCLAGGVALNCVANGKSCASASSTTCGSSPRPATPAARWAPRSSPISSCWKTSGFRSPATASTARCSAPPPRRPRSSPSSMASAPAIGVLNEADLPVAVADLVARQQVVGLCQGRMEYGPRALGARSIIGDARNPEMQRTMNLKIKYRESFRPFAPAVLRERGRRSASTSTPTRPTCCWWRRSARSCAPGSPTSSAMSSTRIEDLCERVSIPRSSLPAITHVDYSARVQIVDRAAPSPVPRHHPGLPRPDRLPGRHQHQLQHPGRAHRLHAAGRLPLLHEHRPRRPGAGGLPAPQGRPAAPR